MINNVHPRGLTTTPRAFHRYGLGLFAVAAGIVVLFTLVNTRVNPIAVTPTPWSDPGFREYRPIYRYQRTAKAGLLRSEPWSTVFLGSSRIDIALDPEHPDWGDTRTVNLALSAGTLPEAAAMFDYAAQRQDIGLTIVGIDLADLTSRFSLMHTAGFMESPLNRNGDKIERELRYYSGISTFEASIRAITSGYGGFNTTGNSGVFTPARGFKGFIENIAVLDTTLIPENDPLNWFNGFAGIGERGFYGLAVWWAPVNERQPAANKATEEVYTHTRYGFVGTDQDNFHGLITAKA